MKKIITAILILLSFTAKAQLKDGVFYTKINPAYIWKSGGFEYNLNIPKLTATTGRDTGGIRYQLSDSSIYVWTGSQWRALGGGGAGVSDGDKGDITVSSSGSVWTIDNLAVTNAKINDVAWSKITSTPTTIAGYGITNGLVSLNALTGQTQTFATGTSGTDFNISSASTTHTFNLPTASASNRGALSSTDWSLFNSKLSYHLIVSATNLGSGSQVFKDTSSNKINLRSIVQGWNTKVTQNTNDITISVDTTTQTLTDGATITFNANSGVSAKVTITASRTLAFSNFNNGMFLSLVVIQDGTGGWGLTLPASTRVIGGGAGAVTLTTAASSHDILTFWKINDIVYCNYGKNYN